MDVSLTPEELNGVLATLLGSVPKDLPEEALSLYCYPERAELVAVMPIFDQWGIVPDGHDGPRGNPPRVVLDTSDSDSNKDSEATTADDNAGRAAPRSHRSSFATSGMMMPLMSSPWQCPLDPPTRLEGLVRHRDRTAAG